LRRSLEAALAKEGITLTEYDYWSAQTALIDEGYISSGKGRGGSVKLIKEPEGGFDLKVPNAKPESTDKVKTTKAPTTPRANSISSNKPPQIISYSGKVILLSPIPRIKPSAAMKCAKRELIELVLRTV